MSWGSRNLASRRFNLGLNQEDALVLGYFGAKFDFRGKTGEEILKAAETCSGLSGSDRMWSDVDGAGNMLSGLVEAVSGVPGGTLNFVDVVAMGGTKWGIPSNFDFGDQITLRFRELSGMPVKNMITSWVNLIRHSNSGVSMLPNGEYTKSNWTADLTYFILRPNGLSVEAGIVFEGIYPMSDLSSQIATDITAVDGLTYDVNFHVDAMYWDSNTTAKAQSIVSERYQSGVDTYMNHQPSSK